MFRGPWGSYLACGCLPLTLHRFRVSGLRFRAKACLRTALAQLSVSRFVTMSSTAEGEHKLLNCSSPAGFGPTR